MRYVSSGLTDFRLLRRCQRETELGMFMFPNLHPFWKLNGRSFGPSLRILL